MEPSPVKIVACFVIFAVIGTEAMNYMAFPRLGRSPRSAIDKLNGRYNGQAFAFPRGRRALDSDVAVDTSLRTMESLDRQKSNHYTNQLKTPLFKTKPQSRIKRSLYNKKHALAHRFGYYSKQPPNDKIITPYSVAQDAKRTSQFPMPRSAPVSFLKDHHSSPEVDMLVSKQGPQEQEEAKQHMHDVFKPENNEEDIEQRNFAGDFFTRSMPRSLRNSVEISNKFPFRKYPMPRSNVSKRSLRSLPILSSRFFTDWWNTAHKLHMISKQFLSNRPKTVQRSVFIMPKRSSDYHIPTDTKRTGFYPMPRNAKRTGFYPMPRNAKRTGFYPMPRSAKRTGLYPMPRSAKRTGFYPMPRNAKRTGFYPMPRSAKRNDFYPMPRGAKRNDFYPMPRGAKRNDFYPMPRSAKRTGFYPMPRSAKRTGLYPMPRSAKRTGFYPMPRSAKRTGVYPMPRSAKRTGFYPMPRSAKRTNFYPMPRKRTDIQPILYQLPTNLLVRSKRSDASSFTTSAEQTSLSQDQIKTSRDTASSGYYPMPRDTANSGYYPMPRNIASSGNYPMPRDTANSGYYPMPRNIASSGNYPMPRDTANSGYYPMPRNIASSGNYPMPRDTANPGYYPMPRNIASSGNYPMPRDTSESGYYPMPRDTKRSGYYPKPNDVRQKVYYPMPRQVAGELGFTSNMTDTGEKLINDSKWLTGLDVITLIDILKNNGLERNDEERSLSKVYEWLDELKKVCSDGYTKCPSHLHELRGYLAFPRLGRSDGQTIQSSEFETECCPEGIKSHWIVIGASKPEIRSRCSPKSVCCEGLEELVGRSSEHIFYTKCVAKINDEKTENTVLDRLLRKS